MRLLITGSNGLLGSNLTKYFSQKKEYEVFTTSQNPSVNPPSDNFTRANLNESASVLNVFAKSRPDMVINTVSLVNVDECESNPVLANKITVKTAEKVAKVAYHYGSRVVYISTDQLFDGKRSMYSEDDSPAPINVYGETKRIAERETVNTLPDTIIVRTNFFGWSPRNHPVTFGEWVYTSIKEKSPINLFTDYFFTPIEVTYFAESLEKAILSKSPIGIINIAGSQRCSKYDFGLALGRSLSNNHICEFDSSLIAQSSLKSFHFKAPRPQDLSLSTEKFRKLFGYGLPTLQENVDRFCKTIPEYER